MARARTPKAPATLATTAPVGAGAPPVELELESEPESEVAAAEIEALLESELS